MQPSGGNAIPVVVTTDQPTGGTAIPVYGYATYPTDRPSAGALPRRVVVITEDDLVENGGSYILAGNAVALPIFTAEDQTLYSGDEPIAVYPINAWPT